MPYPSTLFSELNRDNISEVIDKTLLILPIGSTEQHGPHLPTGTDSFHVEFVAQHAAQQASKAIPVLVAPTLALGISDHHLPFGATLSLSPSTLRSVLIDVGRSAAHIGLRRLFVLNGHGGNHEVMGAAVRELGQASPLHVAAGSWWAIARSALEAEGAHDEARVPGHAGAFETSVMHAICPDLVSDPPTDSNDTSPLRTVSPMVGLIEEHPGFWEQGEGYSDQPSKASSSAGQRYVSTAVSAVAEALIDFYSRTIDEERDD